LVHNVLHILGTAQLQGRAIASIVGALGRGLDPDRYRVEAWFLEGDGPLVNEIRAAGVSARALSWARGVRDPFGALRFMRSLRLGNWSIVHQHFGGRSVQRLVRLATRAKIAIQIHSLALEPGGEDIAEVSFEGYDVSIAVSAAVAERMRGTCPRVIYSGVTLPQVSKAPSHIASSRTVVGAASRLVDLKGLVYLIRAAASLANRVPSIRFEIAGAGPAIGALEHEVKRLELDRWVTFLGWRDDLGEILRNWDIFVQPSLTEGLGIAALEAMAAGLPVVASAVGGLPEIVEEGRTGWLVAAAAPELLADRIYRLTIDPELRASMGAAGRARVRQSFSSEVMVGAVTRLYDDLLAE